MHSTKTCLSLIFFKCLVLSGVESDFPYMGQGVKCSKDAKMGRGVPCQRDKAVFVADLTWLPVGRKKGSGAIWKMKRGI